MRKPSAPALATAEISSDVPTAVIPPQTIGCSMPNSRVKGVANTWSGHLEGMIEQRFGDIADRVCLDPPAGTDSALEPARATLLAGQREPTSKRYRLPTGCRRLSDLSRYAHRTGRLFAPISTAEC